MALTLACGAAAPAWPAAGPAQGIAVSGAPAQAGQDADMPAARPVRQDAPAVQHFALPALPLHDALQRYSAQTGRSVLYDTQQVAGRRSAPVQGRYTEDQALQRLLAGTGIVPRHASRRAVSLAPLAQAAPPSPAAGVPADPARQRFYGQLQARIIQALCARPQIQAGSYRLALRFRLNDIAAIDGLQVHASGRPELEPMIHAALSGLTVGASPPRGAAQPLTLLITPEAAQRHGGCPS